MSNTDHPTYCLPIPGHPWGSKPVWYVAISSDMKVQWSREKPRAGDPKIYFPFCLLAGHKVEGALE